MNSAFTELSLILVVAAAVAGVMQIMRQPLIIGHIITGLLVGPFVLNFIHSTEELEVFSSIGIALLLFIIGLSLQPKVIKEVGKTAVITGLGQIAVTAMAGFGIAKWLGYGDLISVYVAVALTFSSTIIILKLLSDKKELGRLYGKITTGFLLVQDIVAALALIAITSLSQEKNLATLAGTTGLKVGLLVVSFPLLTKFVLPRLSSFFARSQEFLFLFSIGWGFGIATLFSYAGLSIEIGALFAGVALATSPYSYEISARMKPVRDFFIVMFFIMLGAQMQPTNLSALVLPVSVFSIYILIGNPLIMMILMGALKYTKKTSFKTGLAVAQISEFSLILILLGQRVGHLPPEVVSMVTIVGLITIAASAYMIIYSDKLYVLLAPMLSIFERKKLKRDRGEVGKFDVMLFGYKNAGFQFVSSFKQMGHKFVVIDFDPEVIDKLTREGINCIYGDANDSEFLESLGIEKAKLVISVVHEYDTNALILHHVSQANNKAIIILTSDDIDDATKLYDSGATYVMMPHYLGSSKTCTLIEKHGFDLSVFVKERDKHISYLSERGNFAVDPELIV